MVILSIVFEVSTQIKMSDNHGAELVDIAVDYVRKRKDLRGEYVNGLRDVPSSSECNQNRMS